jgi:hypothetical protein
VSLSLQIEEMEEIQNVEDLDSNFTLQIFLFKKRLDWDEFQYCELLSKKKITNRCNKYKQIKLILSRLEELNFKEAIKLSSLHLKKLKPDPTLVFKKGD